MRPLELATEQSRTRRVIGELFAQNGEYLFRYISQNGSLEKATQEGFIGYPSFPEIDTSRVYSNALVPFARRLPERRRSDFIRQKLAYGLNENKDYSDFELLGHFSGRIASDEFELIDPFDEIVAGNKILVELTGVRHFQMEINTDYNGQPVLLNHDEGNCYDEYATKVVLNDGTGIGWINSVQNQNLLNAISNLNYIANIFRTNGRASYPRVFVFVDFQDSIVAEAAE